MSIKVCGVKQANESTSLNALIDEETESKSDAVSDNCTEYSIRNSEHVSDSLMPESTSVDEGNEANLANKNDEDEEDNDEASLDSNYSNKSNSAASKASNDTATMNVPLSSLTTRAQILSNQNEYDESIIIPDDDDDGQDDLPLSQVLSSIKKSKTKGEQSGDEPTTSGNNTLDESISSVAAGKSASFKEYLLDLKKRSLDQKMARENSSSNPKTTLTLLQKQQQLKRKCQVCRRKVPQENLCEHYTDHFDSSAHCVLCHKVTKSPSLYISHFLSHFPPQFYCFFCDRWFKTPASYQRHKDGCSNGVIEEDEVADEIKLKKSRVEEREEPVEKKTKLNQLKELSTSKARTESTFTRSNSIDSKAQKPLKNSEPIETNQIRQNLRKKVPTNYNEQSGTFQQTRQTSANLIDVKKAKNESLVTNKKSDAKNYVVNKLNFNLRKNNANDAKHIQDNEDEDEKLSDYEMKEVNVTENTTDVESSSSKSLVNNIQIKNDTRLELSTTKDLSSCGTYKVKIQRRRSSASISNSQSFKQKENESLINQIFNSSLNENNSGILKEHRKNSSLSEYPLSPQKLMFSSSLASISEQQKLINNNTPSKLSILANTNLTNIPNKDLNMSMGGSNLLASNTSSTSLNMSSSSSSFECPECEKKFVSYYGLVQHYDQHPNLKVTCMLCEITFENHHLLVMHNTNVHHLVEHNHDKVKESLISSNQLLSRKINDSTTSTNQNLNKTGSNQSKSNSINSGKFNLTTKSKSFLDEASGDSLDALSNNGIASNNALNDLSSLPSIMTRTSRLTTAPNAKQSILGASTNNSGIGTISKPTLITSAAILNHTLTVKTSGFADLSFIDFSCVNFPRIAQNYCELWPRKLQLNQLNSSSQTIHSQQQQRQFLQPLHNYMCEKCGFYFPCKASLQLHRIKKSFATSKLVVNEENVDRACSENDSKSFEIENNTNKITSQCQLFMTNSKYLDYEKTLDEIITKIEHDKSLDQFDELQEKSEYLKIFGLVNVSSFATVPISEINPIQISSEKTSQDAQTTILPNSSHKSLNLDTYINPKSFKAINLTEKLLIKLRKQMLNINHQFIVDLNRWKFLHSTETNGHNLSTQISNISFDTSQYSSKIHLKPHVNLNRPLLIRSKKLKRNAQKLLLQSITTKVPIPDTILTPAINNSNNTSHLVTSQKSSNVKPSSNLEKEEPIKIASNGSKSISNNFSKNTTLLSRNLKSRETPEPQQISNKKSNSNITFSKPVFSSTSGNFSAALNLNKNAQKRKANESMPSLLPKNSKQQPKRKLSSENDSNEEIEEKCPIKLIKQENSNTNKKRIQQTQPLTLPPPPLLPIYKTISSTNSSANSSRLASASGMMPPKLPKFEPTLPKLTKISPKPILESKPNYEILKAMPKLKPQQNIINNFGLVPPPPQLEPFGVKLERTKKKSNSTGSDNSNTSTSSSSSNASSVSSSSNSSSGGNEQEKNSKSENMSLKCKFCRTSFHGQSEFFQHVIVKHNKMVKQRINRARVGGDNSNANNRLDLSSPTSNSSNSSSQRNLVNSTMVEANTQSSIS